MKSITNFERRMRIVFGVAFAVLFSTIAVSIFVINRLQDNADWVAHTHEVIAEVNLVHVHFGDARVATKNYLLSHQARHLAPRVNAFQQIDEGMAKLKSLTRDNPIQVKYLKDTDLAIQEYIRLTAQVIDEVDTQERVTPERFAYWTDQTEADGRKASAQFVKMRQEEESLLTVRQEGASSFVNQAYSIMPFMLAVQLVITTYIYYGVLNNVHPTV